MDEESAVTPSVEIPADRERVARTIFEWKNRNPLVPRSWDRAMKLERADCYSEADALFDAGLLAGPCPACAAPAVPQPVDREALTKAMLPELMRQGVDRFFRAAELAEYLADAVLAGEQEQVESPAL